MRITAEKLLRELIALPTVNPAFLAKGDPHSGEKKAMDFLATVAAQEGLAIEMQEVLPGRANLLARLLPAGEVKHRVILAPHLDTVNATEDEFKPRKHAGRIYGRGACDTKGSAAAMLTAIGAVARGGRRPQNTEIIFAGLIDEENMQAGSRALAASGLKADLAIVGEATRLKVVTAHKGSLWLRFETQGRSAHGSRPELGRNAIYKMARVVEVLEVEYAAKLRERRHPVLGAGTTSVGTIRGGTQPNIVPDSCVVLLDRRTLPGETEESVLREIKSLLRAHLVKAEVRSCKQEPCYPLETDIRLPFVARFLEGVGQRRALGAVYFCDASVLARKGIPSVVFGPGDIAQAHTAQEWVSLKSLEGAVSILQRFLSSLP